ncbi:diaminopimelate decarboxylase [Candidatus Desantisbacteria bacterium CG1_02_38_46]|uniref:Diaminopimelate decarboxylase n=3 Tax=unclassified Candidatus Desantisiibacteriota TaxID=3106372 RepID=A0A2H9PCA1_9BACT|nr:MAG: diaminopimelate decarboxylase [Candidatus Desantisbacteria bacterium CG1_02_38_46]PIU52093.1 MAG: diaminopimelate decarboxylase [Candidatus Desantisbacteria bacterium CG07_land_8_20_14_0_80_39_15]PIZ16807.1 MAG: diaminopimelate decarboxylase [Candidatus Desantisbacteria bacterium CG_4_10_14_0_8_um_filter_39_17]
MEVFRYVGGKLYCEGVSIEKIAKELGTPFYMYSHSKIEENYRELDAALGRIPHLICYAVKANSNLSILGILKNLGSGFDVLSGGELYKVLKIKADPRKIVFDGVGKTKEEIEYGILNNILMFNVESFSELLILDNIAKKLKKEVPVGIRINFGIDPHSAHRYIDTSKGSKFGLEANEAKKIYLQAKKFKNIKLVGLHSHIGSQILEVKPFEMTFKLIFSFVEELKKQGINLKYIDVGGGLGIPYKENENKFPLKEYARALSLFKNCKVILETGRFIVGNSAILVTKVLYIKNSFGKTFVIVDSGMNDLIRPSLYGAYHRIIPIIKLSNYPIVRSNVVGPVCETGDFFALNRKMPLPKEGDLLAVRDTGAYGFEMSSNYNSHCRIPQILVKGKQFSIIRQREKYADLIKGE